MQRAEGQRPDVKLVFVQPLLESGVDSFISEELSQTPIYLATNAPRRYYQIDAIERKFKLEQHGVVYKVIKYLSGTRFWSPFLL
jgi:hypothetical protein